jgi:class 3 adenylate cyclase/tetratricopeptide (TPR) repeat protein
VTIRCPSCGAEQAAGARFCSACGAALYIACPNCGAEQAAGASFCSSCGYALGEAGRASGADERQERRIVTILFADLAGSTALGERLDPEDVRDLQGDLFELVNTEVERFGGTTEKFVGDAVLAVFGIPRAHEDDAERAVRAGLAAQQRFEAFAGGVRERFGGDVGLRVGVNTGEVVAGRESAARGELMVSGDAVNVAARLQQAAAPGQVLVGERTYAATSRSISYDGAIAVTAKGKSEPVPAWVATEVLEEPGARPLALHAPLVGRAEELAILTAVAGRVERERAPQLVTLYGPAGVGKSRLLAELLQRLPQARVLEGRCLPYGEDIAYWPLAEAAKAEAGILDTDPTETALEKLRQAVADVVLEEAARVSDALAWTIGLSLPDAAATGGDVAPRLQRAWLRYLTSLGHDRLTILAIEDIHWASLPLLDLLEGLSDALNGTSVLVLCTARTELLEARPTWGAAKQNATALTLAPLDGEKAAQLISSLLGEDGVPDAVRQRVLASAEGNPFFVEELLHMLIEQGALERRGDRWTTTESVTELPLPDSIHGVIAARIDLLDAEARDALRRCSVIGRVFWPEAAGVGEQAIATLGTRDLVLRQPGSSMAGMKEFAFKHALTREVAYASLPRAERRELHRRVAEWVQEVAPDRGVEAAELAAYHYLEALTYGEDDPTVSRRTYELLLTAGDAAYERGAVSVAITQLERALELAPDPAATAGALLALARADVAVSDAPGVRRSIERLDRALALVDPADAPLRGDILGWQSRVLWLHGSWDEARSAADEAVVVLRGLPESPQLARVLARSAQLAMLRDDEDANVLAEEALAVANRVGDKFAAVNATISRMTVAALRGTAPDPGTVLETITVARDDGALEEAFRALINFLWSASGYLTVDEVERTAELAESRLAGLPSSIWVNAYLDISLVAQHLIPAGRWDKATEIIERWDGEELTATNRVPWLGARAQLALRRGDLETAGVLAREHRELALKTREPQRIIPMANAVLPWAALAGQREELRAAADEILELVGRRWSAVISALPATRAIAAAGELELLRRWTDSLGAGTARHGRAETTELAARGLLALHDGRTREAVPLLSEAAERDRALGYLFDAATLDLDVAAALEAAGDRGRATGVRDGAEVFLASIGCVNPL